MRVLRRMLGMCDLAWEVTERALALCCVLLFCAFMLLADAGGYSAETHATYRLAWGAGLRAAVDTAAGRALRRRHRGPPDLSPAQMRSSSSRV